MKLWHYHALSVLAGIVVLALCGLVMPIGFLFFVLFQYYIAFAAVAYILGRMVLSYSLPGTYKKIQEKACQRTDDVA